VGDRVSMLEHAWYSVLVRKAAPASCGKTGTPENTQLAADAIKLTSRDLAQLGVIDEIIPEPPGGAHRDSRETANTLKDAPLATASILQSLSTPQLLEHRYNRSGYGTVS